MQRRLSVARFALGYLHGIDRGRELAQGELDAVWAAPARNVQALRQSWTYAKVLHNREAA